MSSSILPTPPSTLYGGVAADDEEPDIPEELRDDLELTARNPKGKHGGGQARTAEDRRESAQRSATAQKAIWDDIGDVWAKEDDMAKVLASKHGTSFLEMKHRIQRFPGYGRQREVNGWNAVEHITSIDVASGQFMLYMLSTAKSLHNLRFNTY